MTFYVLLKFDNTRNIIQTCRLKRADNIHMKKMSNVQLTYRF